MIKTFLLKKQDKKNLTLKLKNIKHTHAEAKKKKRLKQTHAMLTHTNVIKVVLSHAQFKRERERKSY